MDRHEAIKKIIQKEAISDQNTLIELLYKHYNIQTTQAVVSRDLRKLGIVKKVIQGSLIYELPTIDTATEILKLGILDIDHNESMIVIKTFPALAAFVGDNIDQHEDLDVLGCLAGENTVFVTPKSIKDIQKTYQTLCEKLHFKKTKGPHHD